jgi:hypothetical protein
MEGIRNGGRGEDFVWRRSNSTKQIIGGEEPRKKRERRVVVWSKGDGDHDGDRGREKGRY